ncbi:MAG: hypothetical protein R2873_26420 [Caldilineaceae bacterium]
MTNYVTKPIPAHKPDVEHVVRPWGSVQAVRPQPEVTVSLMTVTADQRLSLVISHRARRTVDRPRRRGRGAGGR